jgi:hypothetical protein
LTAAALPLVTKEQTAPLKTPRPAINCSQTTKSTSCTPKTLGINQKSEGPTGPTSTISKQFIIWCSKLNMQTPMHAYFLKLSNLVFRESQRSDYLIWRFSTKQELLMGIDKHTPPFSAFYTRFSASEAGFSQLV